MNKGKIIIGISIFIVVLIICYVFITKFITKSIFTPDKIIIYHSGTQTEITKNNPSFNKIVNCMDDRVSSNSCMAQMAIPENWELEIKNNDELGVEFIYSKEHTFNYKKSYTRLFFPIKSKRVYYENLMFFSIKDQYYNGPISLSPCSKKLLDLLKDFK